MLNESIYDKGKLKFIFLAGAPGSGKTHLAKQLFDIKGNSSFGATGLKLVSFDHIFEFLLAKKGHSLDLNVLPIAERESIRAKARQLMKRQMAHYIKNGTGMVFDGTGSSFETFAARKRDLEDLGYDTSMVYVDSLLLSAANRNSKRARKLPPKLLHRIWKQVKANKDRYKKLFKDDMVVIDNSYNKPIASDLETAVHNILQRPVENKIGKWRLEHGGKLPKPKRHHYDSPFDTSSPWKVKFPPRDGERGWGALGWTKSKKTPPSEPPASTGGSFASNYDDTHWDWWNHPVKRHTSKPMEPQKETPKEKPLGQDDPTRTTDDPAEQKVRNPKTGNDILLKTALGYPPDHPARQEAERIMRELNPNDQPPPPGHPEHDDPDY